VITFPQMLTHGKRLTAIFLLLFSLSNHSVAQTRQPTKRPRLVLVIVVDQFRYDYLTRFKDLFGPGGFKRLMRDGAHWTNANYPFIPTKTAPGHTAIMTGAPPSVSGIVANEWIERETARKVTSVGDSSAKLLGGGRRDGGESPRRLLASTVGDELRRATGERAKVIGISGKPRAAILPAGRLANAAYWLSSSSGNLVSSDYYFPELPDWVRDFNRTQPLLKYFGARWERLLPESEYRKHAGADSAPWEKVNEPGDTNVFPHTITGGAEQPGDAFYDALDHSPFINEELASFAKLAIEKEQLGADDVTDLLSVSFSGNDYVGHRFGPHSQEVMDMALRVDRQIAALLDFVDARIGLKNTLVVFSSDHGVAPLLGQSAAQGIVPTEIRNADVMRAIRSAIREVQNPKSKVQGPVIDDYIFKYRDGSAMKDALINGNVYFNLEALKRDGMNLDEITKVAGEAALKVPGIARYFTRSQLERCRTSCPRCETDEPGLRSNQRVSPSKLRQTGMSVLPCSGLRDPVGQRVLRGFDPKLSGDLIVVQKPFLYLADSFNTANHGSPYSYDTHVPVIIMGQGFRPGHYPEPATPLDIAPTVATVLGIATPNKSQGRILREALDSLRSRKL
jgi:predicted AlkP superfamily pyrophosphatase or phosphodiesterase